MVLLAVLLIPAIVSAAVFAAGAVNPPTGLTAVPSAEPAIARLTWTAPADTEVARYLIYAATEESGPYTCVISTTETTAVYEGGVPGMPYYFRVTAVREGDHDESGFVQAGPVRSAWSASPHVDSAPDIERCPRCHAVHSASASASADKLARVDLASPDPTGMCANCHDGRVTGAANVTSGTTDSFALASGHAIEPTSTRPLALTGCDSCHYTHGSTTSARMLPTLSSNGTSVTVGGNELCLTCHDSANSWYGTGYPSTKAPTRDETGYPVSGTWVGPGTYAGVSNAHRLIPESTQTPGPGAPIRRGQGDCLYCHAAHRGSNAYDSLVATFAPPSASTLASDQSVGSYAALCLTCHSGAVPSGFATAPANIKRFVTAGAAGSGHRVRTAGGNLPVGSPVPCYECHNPHGSQRSNASMLSDERGGALNTSTDAGVRKFCFTCHTTADTGAGWDSTATVLAVVSAGDKVVGLRRDGVGGNVLRLPTQTGHAAADTMSCYLCHGDSYEADGYNVHNPSLDPYVASVHTASPLASTYTIGGAEYGPVACGECHSTELGVEHAKTTSTGYDLSCGECHPSPRDSVGPSWNPTTCAQGNCHAGSSPAPMHAGIDGAHTVLPADSGCTSGEVCHTSDLAGIHSAATTTVVTPASLPSEATKAFSAGGGVTPMSGTRTVTGCGVCHASGVPTTRSCTACHTGTPHSTDIAALHATGPGAGAVTVFPGWHYVAASPVERLVDCTMCHASNLLDQHGSDCVLCHSSTKPAVVEAIRSSNGACTACHPGYHSDAEASAAHVAQTVDDCAPCHDSGGEVTNAGCMECHDGPIDTTPPVTISDARNSYVGQADVHFSATDNAGPRGVKATWASIDGAPASKGTSVTVVGDGVRTLRFWSVDYAGNRENTQTVTFTIAPDVTAPVTVSNVRGAYNATATVNLAATDAGAGVLATYFTMGGGQTVTGTVATVGTSGSHTLRFWSVDRAGNAETTKTATFVIDRIVPVTTSDALTTYGSAARITLTPSDSGGSGLAATRYRLDGGSVASGTVVNVAAEGAHTLQFWSVDGAGNVEPTRTATFMVDGRPPVTTSDARAAYNTDPTIHLSATDGAGSGVARTWYSVDGATPTSGTVLTLYADGPHTLEFASEDMLGNREATKSVNFVIDRIVPATTSDALSTNDGEATIHLIPFDAGGSSLKATHYRLDGGAVQTGTVVWTAVDGPHLLDYWSEDNAGNVEATNTIGFSVVGISDKMPPMTSSNAVATYVGTAAISLTATDNGGWGVVDTFYRLDGGPATKGTSISVAASANGADSHVLSFWSTDQAGNAEAPRTARFVVSPVPTSTLLSISNPPFMWDFTLYNAAGGVADSISWEDGLSPQFALQSGGPYSVVGSISETGASWDTVTWSGIYVPPVGMTLVIDAPPPDAIAPVTFSDVVSRYYLSATVNLSATDLGGSGLSATRYRLDGGAVTVGSVVSAGPGSHTLEFWSTDNAGNVERTRTVAFEVAASDTVAPSTISDAQHSYVGTATLHLLSADDFSGVARTEYRVDSGPTLVGTSLVIAPPASGIALHTVTFWSTDRAGNIEVSRSATFTVDQPDLIAPVTTSNVTASYTGTATITLSATDAGGSGVAATYYTLDGGVRKTGTSLTVPAPSSLFVNHTLKFWSVDGAGNSEATMTVTFKVNALPDTTPPVTISDVQPSYSGTQTVNIRLTATDPVGGWGLGTTYYTLDGGARLSGNRVLVSAPATGTAVHTLRYWSVDLAGNSETTQTAVFSVAATAGSATLTFRWEPPYGMATLHVEDSLGHVIASTDLEGPPTSLNWMVPVASGQNYRMVVDYYFDGNTDEGGGYGIWTGVLNPGQNYVWWY